MLVYQRVISEYRSMIFQKNNPVGPGKLFWKLHWKTPAGHRRPASFDTSVHKLFGREASCLTRGTRTEEVFGASTASTHPNMRITHDHPRLVFPNWELKIAGSCQTFSEINLINVSLSSWWDVYYNMLYTHMNITYHQKCELHQPKESQWKVRVRSGLVVLPWFIWF